MSAPKIILIKESTAEINALLKKASNLIMPRLRMLLEMQKHEKEGISKRTLAEIVGVNHNSIQTWRSMYIKGGIELLCSHNKKGFRPSVFNAVEHQAICEKLNDPNNGLRGYKELLIYLEQEFNKVVKYNTLLKYCVKNFKSKIKVARKSHVKKDAFAVDTFKKTSVKSVKMQSKKKK